MTKYIGSNENQIKNERVINVTVGRNDLQEVSFRIPTKLAIPLGILATTLCCGGGYLLFQMASKLP